MRSLIRFTVALLFGLAGSLAMAQDVDQAKLLDDARQQIADIRKQLAGNDLDDGKLNGFRDALAGFGGQADAVVNDRTPKLAALDARLAELGPAPPKGTVEAPDIAAQRADLDKQRTALDAEIKRAKLLSVDSQQLANDVAEERRAQFQARLSQRTSSPLSPAFWKDVGGNLDRDGARLGALRDGVVTAIKDSFADDNRTAALGGLAFGLFMIVFGRWGAERALMRLTADRVPQGRLRRSALAFAVVVVATAFTGVGAQAIAIGLNWHNAFSDSEQALAGAIIAAVFFGSFVAGLGRGLLSAARPSWRLPPIPDDVAQRLRIFPLMLGFAVAFGVLQRRINSLVGASLSATIAGSLFVALVYGGIFVWALLRTGKVADNDADAPAPARSPYIGVVIAVLWLGVAAALLATIVGYIAFAYMVVRQMMWLGIVAASLYLLIHLIEDLSAAVLSSRAKWAQKTLGLESRILDQIAVLSSGAFRLLALLLALVAAVAPFGTDPDDLISRGSQIGAGLKIGQIEITPSAVIGAMFVFLIGLAAIRALQGWLYQRYLPTTKLDPGMRSSVTTLLGYVGGVVVFAFALSAMGLSLERIAWVASALSVGIGFGLQAVVQNFVSGLILLIERPVKVGDWVVLGDTEGDIRRINVRATEIQMADRSTVIVPNSELITKSVRNVTLANAEGRVRVRLPMPIDSDAVRVRELMLVALTTHAGVLATPVPAVLLDGIEGSSLIFIAIAYIANPRQAASIRSELFMDVLARLRDDGIALATPYDLRLQQAPSTSPEVVSSAVPGAAAT